MKRLTVEEMFEKHPLTRFSPYSQMQASTVRNLAHELIESLDACLDDSEGRFVITDVGQIHGRFWLWVLGAYEVTRTMDQHGACFSDRLASEAKAFKRRLAVVRIPFAKQEIAGTAEPVSTEGSISEIDLETKDIRFTIGDTTVSIRELAKDFIAFFEGIQPGDVQRDIRSAQAAKPPLRRPAGARGPSEETA